MNQRPATRRTLVRLMLTLLPPLLVLEAATAQLAPVINAEDPSWMDGVQPPQAVGGYDTGGYDTGGYGYGSGDSVIRPVPQGTPINNSPMPGGQPMMGYGDPWGNPYCGAPCDCCPPAGSCMPPPPKPTKRIDIYGEYLYLRPRNAEVAYAVPIDGPITPVDGNGIQIGPTALVDPNHHGAYRVGFNVVGCGCSSIGAQWTQYENSISDFVNIGVPDVLRSLVTHPLGVNAATDGLQASAQLDIDFELIDLLVRTPWKRCQQWHADVVYGVRYATLDQNFFSSIDVNGSTDVFTDIEFSGVGPQIGLSSIRQLGQGGFHLYSRGDATFLVGSFEAQYIQQDAFAGELVNSSWESGRVVPLLEMELGVGWATCGGRFHLRSGYLVNAWFNAVRTSEFINSVQANDPDGLGSGITFDGLVVRGEFRF